MLAVVRCDEGMAARRPSPRTKNMAPSKRSRAALLTMAYMFLESSSSSESSDEGEMACVLQFMKDRTTPRTRPFSIMSRMVELLKSFSDEQFRRDFRISKMTCGRIISRFRRSEYYPQEDTRRGKAPSPPEHHILAFLLFAGKKCCLREVAKSFGIAESSLHRQIYRVMDFFAWLIPDVIAFPQTEEQKARNEKEFEAIEGFPGVIGVIDSTHITVRTPAHSKKQTYKNKKDVTSIMLQGIFNAEGRFMDVFTGVPSSIPRAEVLEMAPISKTLPELCGSDQHIIGSEAYPLREWLMVPYSPCDEDELTDAQKEFNGRLNATRAPSCNVLVSLKQRFRQLSKLEFHSLDTMTKFVLSCCVLHNLCLDENDFWECDDDSDDEEDDDDDEEEQYPHYYDNCRQKRVFRSKGVLKRDSICMRLRNRELN